MEMRPRITGFAEKSLAARDCMGGIRKFHPQYCQRIMVIRRGIGGM
jgi:hypothetical protein